MNIDERLEMLVAVQASHDDQIGRLVEEGARLDRRIDAVTNQINALGGQMDQLTKRTGQVMEAINQLGNIAQSHEDRIGHLEDQK